MAVRKKGIGKGLRDRDVAWEAQKGSQELFLQADIFEMLATGPRGGGKSEVILVDFLQHVGVGWGPDWRGILFRETYPQLDDVVKKTKKLFMKVFPSARFNVNNHTWIFPDGEQLMLRHMKTTADYDNYHGHEIPFIAWEELTNWANLECYTLMQSCCRSSVNPAKKDIYGRSMPRKYRASTNPYGKGFNAVRKHFQLPEMMGKVIREVVETPDGMKEMRPRLAMNFAFEENIALKTAEPDYLTLAAQAARNPAERAAWLYGSWDITSGGMFDDVWRPKTHVIEPFGIPPSWFVDRTFDWGSSRPASVCWWAESDGSDVTLQDGSTRATMRGDLFLIAEWYICGKKSNEGARMSAADIAKGIVLRELSMKLRGRVFGKDRVRPGSADSSIWDSDTGPSIASQMQKAVLIDGMIYPGIYWEKANKTSGSRKTGAQILRERLENATCYPRERPGIFIFNTCRKWIELVPILPRDDKDLDDVDSDAEDHCFAAGTMVRTPSGDRAIETLIGESGEVFTVDGAQNFENARLTRRAAPVVEVEFSDGVKVVCTPDHKIMRNDGIWIEAKDSAGSLPYNIDSYHRNESCAQRSSPELSRNSIASDTTSAGSTSGEMVNCYTGLFGTIIGEISRKVLTSIIGMKTVLGIISPTSNAFSEPCMAGSMPISEILDGIPTPKKREISLFAWLLNGIAAKKVADGIVKTGERIPKEYSLKQLIGYASNVAVGLRPAYPRRPLADFVRIIANRFGDGNRASTTRPDAVKSAVGISPSTNTSKTDSVLKSAPVSVIAVRDAGVADIYCLTVPSHGHFALANGTVVSNCYDATRYKLLAPKNLVGFGRSVGTT